MDKFMCDTDEMSMLKNVYEKLQDDESRKIYVARSIFSLSDDRKYMLNVIKSMTLSKYMLENIAMHKNQKIVLFGAGTWGNMITTIFDNIKWDYVVDNNKVGQTLNGYFITDLNSVENIEDCYVVLAVLFEYREIEKQLIDKGITRENILVLGKRAEECQYFDLPELKFGNKEVFIDAGGFNGASAIQFSEITKGKYDKIYVFEPSIKAVVECRQNLKDLHDCYIIEKGTWNNTGTLYFSEDGEGSHIVTEEESTEKIETISIDEMLKGGGASFIKMDIEGAEFNSLLGARETICQYKPKLAISVYHKRDDVWKIPMLLLSYNPDYKFYLLKLRT